MDQTEEALGYAAEGKKFAEEYTPPDVSIKDVGKFVAEMTPIVGDAMAAKQVYDELQKNGIKPDRDLQHDSELTEESLKM